MPKGVLRDRRLNGSRCPRSIVRRTMLSFGRVAQRGDARTISYVASSSLGGGAAGCDDVSRFTETITAAGDAALTAAAAVDDTVAAAVDTTAPATGILLLTGFAGTAPALIVTAPHGP